MITLSIPCNPSRHRRDGKHQIIEAIKYMPAIKQITKQRYRLKIILYGKWNNLDGSPKRRDPDSVVIQIMDAIAHVCGFDDKWINRCFSVEAIHSENEIAEVTLTPL